MKFHGGVDWDEMYDMPVVYKDWFLKRLAKEMKAQGENDVPLAGNMTPQRRINFQQLQQAFSDKSDR